jgi:hypothetical protein
VTLYLILYKRSFSNSYWIVEPFNDSGDFRGTYYFLPALAVFHYNLIGMPVPPATDAAHEVSHETPATAVPASEPVPSEPPKEPEAKPEDTNDKVVHIATTTDEQAKEIATSTPAEADDVLPDYALQYAPIVYLDEGEEYFPGIPTAHCSYMRPRKFTGEEVVVPEELKEKVSMLKLDDVNKPDVFLTMHHVRETSGGLDQLKSIAGKPDANGRSEAPVWIVVRDKTGLLGGEGTVEDVFYFCQYCLASVNLVDKNPLQSSTYVALSRKYFASSDRDQPYNLGNTVRWPLHIYTFDSLVFIGPVQALR